MKNNKFSVFHAFSDKNKKYRKNMGLKERVAIRIPIQLEFRTTYAKKTLARKKLLGSSVALSKIQQFKELTFYLVSLLFSHSLCAV